MAILDKKVVAVSGKTLLTAKKKGTATLTGTYGKKKIRLNVTVHHPNVTFRLALYVK